MPTLGTSYEGCRVFQTLQYRGLAALGQTKMNNSNDLQPIKSKLISGYSYDAATRTLSVAFVSSPDDTHLYSPVDPPTMSLIFDSSGSIGSNFIRLIKRNGQIKHTLSNE